MYLRVGISKPLHVSVVEMSVLPNWLLGQGAYSAYDYYYHNLR